jgi:hypothetical protein
MYPLRCQAEIALLQLRHCVTLDILASGGSKIGHDLKSGPTVPIERRSGNVLYPMSAATDQASLGLRLIEKW